MKNNTNNIPEYKMEYLYPIHGESEDSCTKCEQLHINTITNFLGRFKEDKDMPLTESNKNKKDTGIMWIDYEQYLLIKAWENLGYDNPSEEALNAEVERLRNENKE